MATTRARSDSSSTRAASVMGMRGQRFALVIEDGVVKQVHVEAPGEFKVSSAEHILGAL